MVWASLADERSAAVIKTKKHLTMKSKAIFYHAGCPVCLEAEITVESLIDRNAVDLEIVHLGENKSRLPEAESAGVNSVPALLFGDKVTHLNFGAALSALR